MDNYKYKAFISYRHKEPDKEVAGKLQKMLESYKPPKSVSGKDFKRWRVFRDETELNTGSSLGDNITNALDNSEFLIVVCSESTKDSKWCMQEITHFKELHKGSNKNIITVVADGDPNKVFPPELCNETVIITDEDGREFYENREIEPLAANIAGANKKESIKKLKSEFLRVAAPLMGCDYDDLFKRNQKKKIRQIIMISALIMALLLAFGLYSSAMLFQINAKNEQLQEQKMQLNSSYEELKITNEELEKKTKEANDNYLEAQSQKETAETNLAEAERQKKIAEDNLKEAQRQKKLAEDNLKEAQRQKKMAEDNLAEATRQKTIAQAQKQKADENAAEAVLQKSYAEENMRIAQNNEAKANEANRSLTEKNAEILASQANIYYADSRLVNSAVAARDAIRMQQNLGMGINANAQRILTDAIGAYNTSTFAIKDIVSVSNSVEKMLEIPGGDFLLIVDKSDYVYTIDLNKRKIISSKYFENCTDVKATEDTVYLLTYSKLFALESETLEEKWSYASEGYNLLSNGIVLNNTNSNLLIFDFAGEVSVLSDTGELLAGLIFNQEEDRVFDYEAAVFSDDYLYISDASYLSGQKQDAGIYRINVTTGAEEASFKAKVSGNVISMYKNKERLFALVADGYKANIYALDGNDLSLLWSTEAEKATVYFTEYGYNKIGEYMIDDVHYVAFLTSNGFFALNYDTGEIASSRVIAENAEILGYMYTSPVGVNVITTKGWELCHLDETLVLGNNFYDGGYGTKGLYVSKRGMFIYADDLAEIYIYQDISNENVVSEDIITVDAEYRCEEVFVDNGYGVLASISKKGKTGEFYEFKIDLYDVVNKSALSEIYVSVKEYDISIAFIGKDRIFVSDGKNGYLYSTDGTLLSDVDLIEEGKAKTNRSWISFHKDFEMIGEYIICEGYSDCLVLKVEGDTLQAVDVISAQKASANSSGDFVLTMNGADKKKFFTYCVNGSEPVNIYDGENLLELENDNCEATISDDGRFIVILSGKDEMYLYNTEDKSLKKKEFKPTDKIPTVVKVSPDGEYIIAIATDKVAVKYSTSDLEDITLSEEWIGGMLTTEINFISDNDVFLKKDSVESVIFDCESMAIRTQINKGKLHFINSENLIAGYDSTKKTVKLQKYFSVDEILSMADEFIEKYKVE